MNRNTDIRSYNDGGRESKQRKQHAYADQYYAYWVGDGNTYYIRSSVLGGEVITEVNRYGGKLITKVFANGAVLATQ